MDDFEKTWNPKPPKKKEELPELPPLGPMTSQPMITISIGQPAPAIDPGLLGAIEDECEDSDEFTSDLDDYSKPNPMRALKALFGK